MAKISTLPEDIFREIQCYLSSIEWSFLLNTSQSLFKVLKYRMIVYSCNTIPPKDPDSIIKLYQSLTERVNTPLQQIDVLGIHHSWVFTSEVLLGLLQIRCRKFKITADHLHLIPNWIEYLDSKQEVTMNKNNVISSINCTESKFKVLELMNFSELKDLHTSRNLQKLILTSCPLIETISCSIEIRELKISFCPKLLNLRPLHSNGILQSIAHLSNLTSLHYAHSQTLVLENIIQKVRLHNLYVSDIQTLDKSREYFGGESSLTTLTLKNYREAEIYLPNSLTCLCMIDTWNIGFLNYPGTLRSVSITSNNYIKAFPEGFSRIPFISLSSCSNLSDISCLNAQYNKKVILGHCGSIMNFDSLRGIRSVEIHFNENLSDLSPLSESKEVSLHLIKVVDVSPLKDCEVVRIIACWGLSSLKSLGKVKELEIAGATLGITSLDMDPAENKKIIAPISFRDNELIRNHYQIVGEKPMLSIYDGNQVSLHCEDKGKKIMRSGKSMITMKYKF